MEQDARRACSLATTMSQIAPRQSALSERCRWSCAFSSLQAPPHFQGYSNVSLDSAMRSPRHMIKIDGEYVSGLQVGQVGEVQKVLRNRGED